MISALWPDVFVRAGLIRHVAKIISRISLVSPWQHWLPSGAPRSPPSSAAALRHSNDERLQSWCLLPLSLLVLETALAVSEDLIGGLCLLAVDGYVLVLTLNWLKFSAVKMMVAPHTVLVAKANRLIGVERRDVVFFAWMMGLLSFFSLLMIWTTWDSKNEGTDIDSGDRITHHNTLGSVFQWLYVFTLLANFFWWPCFLYLAQPEWRLFSFFFWAVAVGLGLIVLGLKGTAFAALYFFVVFFGASFLYYSMVLCST